jgi:hypothetical protein
MNTQYRGEIFIGTRDKEGTFFFRSVYSAFDLISEENISNTPIADSTEAPFEMPNWAWNPKNFFEPVDVDGDTPVLIIQYRDQLQKPYPLPNGYQITVWVAYIEKNSEVEKLPEPERRKIYERGISEKLLGFASQ